MNKKYEFDKNNLYLKNILWLMFLSPKIELIFSIIATINKIKYMIENGVVLEIPEKLIIMAINPLVCYLIIEVSNIRLLLSLS